MKALVVIVGIVVLTLTGVTIFIGASTFEGTVVDKPYEAGLAFEADNANRVALGWSVSLARTDYPLGEGEFLVIALDRDRKPLVGAEVAVILSRPSTSAYDKSYPAPARQEGGYLAKVTIPLPGTWDVNIRLSRGDNATTFVEKIRTR